jgi:hypothetical protein
MCFAPTLESSVPVRLKVVSGDWGMMGEGNDVRKAEIKPDVT